MSIIKCNNGAETIFPTFTDKDHWPANNPDLNPFDLSIWDELAHAVNWDKITSKNTLIIEQLERFINKLSVKVVRVRLVDCITYLKMMEIIFDKRNNLFL